VSIAQAIAGFQALSSNPFGNGTIILEMNGTKTLGSLRIW
jgi:hypothetical protein